MRIAVSARSLDYPACGVKQYLVSLTRTLLEQDKRNEYLIFHSTKEHLGTFPAAREIALGTKSRLGFDWYYLPLALKKYRPDVLFIPSSNMPPFACCPCVTAMLDLGYFHEELKMYKGLDTVYMKWAIRYAARKAARLLAISDYTKRDLLRLTKAKEQNIDVVHLAAARQYLTVPPAEALAEFKARHGLDRPFFLYTGNISPRKNLQTLLKAFAGVSARFDCELVLTGGMHWGVAFEELTRAPGLSGRVRRLGHVPDQEMPLLYRLCLGFVFPSLFEGFGLPILEAQACGAPVVSSIATSLPEVAGAAALYVDPLDAQALTLAMLRLAEEPKLREELIAKGQENLRRFSWEKTAQETLAALEKAVAGQE